MNNLITEVLDHISAILKALAHPQRLRIFEMLAHGEKSVSEIQNSLDLPQAVVSQQLRIMKSGGVVICRRVGSSSRYRLANPGLLHLLKCLQGCQQFCLTAATGKKPKGYSHD